MIFKKSLEQIKQRGLLDGEITDVFKQIIDDENIIHADLVNGQTWYNANTMEELQKARDFFNKK